MSEKLTARLRALGNELLKARNTAGLTMREAANRLDTSLTTMSRIENGLRTPRSTMVAGMMVAYGVSGDERQRLMKLCEDVKHSTWLEVPSSYSSTLRALIDFEVATTSIVQFAPMVIPGLLQTPAYARTIFTSALHDNDTANALTSERLGRQEVLDKIVSPAYTAFIDEAALRRGYGGSQVMAGQIRWMIERTRERHIDIRIVPFRRGGYGREVSFFALLGFRDAPMIAYTEGISFGGFLDERGDITRLNSAATKIETMALTSSESVKFMEVLVSDYERGRHLDHSEWQN